jgi:uncharacterized protein YndB with AHSA1/START domain
MSATMSSTDRIEQQIQLDFPRSRVWRALTDAQEFGRWFGCELEGQFTPGTPIRGRITNKGFEFPIELAVDRIEPERLFSFRWHPFAIDPAVDYSHEPMTLVTFTLEPVGAGTLLKVVETGFDAIPAARRAKAFEMNNNGWKSQMERIRKYLVAGA